MKKFLAIALALSIVLGLCACGGNGGGGDKDPSGKVKLSIGLGTNAKVMSYKDNALTKWLEEQTGYELEFVEYAGGTDVATQISTTVAARQELPDILWGVTLNEDAISTYGRDGYFVDLSPYYEDREGASKTFWTRLEECLTEEEQDTVIRKITDADSGGMYAVPTIETSTIDTMYYQIWIRTDWLDEFGLSKPTNNEELYNVLKAFATKKDAIPLFGTQKATSSARVIDWLINLFVYYDQNHRWQPDENGQLQFVYTQDAYREALKYVHKLYSEGLLSNMVYTASSSECKQVVGTGLCGIIGAHLTSHVNYGDEIMYKYEPLKTWGYAVCRDFGCNPNTYITADCDYPDEAFNLLMTMFSWDGAMRIRYGEYGVDWTDPDEGAKSEMGLDATYKMINDPFTQQNASMWGTIASTLNAYAEGETAQASDNLDKWTATKAKMHAESRRLFDEAAAEKNPEIICPTLVSTAEEKEAIEMVRTNIGTYASKMEMAFITGIGEKCDIESDADWNAFLKTLDDMGLDQYQKYVQTSYDRQ